MSWHHLLPHGLVRALSWVKRFRRVGLSRAGALRGALSSRRKSDLMTSRYELFPASLRAELRWAVDVGANEGLWSEALCGLTAVERIDAFEPHPAAFSLLERRLGGRPGVHLHRRAIGDRDGQQELHVTRSSVFSSLLAPSAEIARYYERAHVDVVERIPVAVSTLDSALAAIPGEISLLKLDVQGFERQALIGGREVLARTRALLVEVNFFRHYESAVTFGALCELLEDELGFELWSFAEPFRDANERALWTDALFLRRAWLQR